MNSNLVPDYETCQKLLVAGFPPDTALAWGAMREEYDHFYAVQPKHNWSHEDWHQVSDEHERIPAPTFQEIWECLPVIFTKTKATDGWESEEMDFGPTLEFLNATVSTLFYIGYDSTFDQTQLHCCHSGNLAQAAAEMWLWAKKNHPEAFLTQPA